MKDYVSIITSHFDKSLVFLAGLLDHIRRCRRYIFRAGNSLQWRDILVTSSQCAGKCIRPTYTCSLAVDTLRHVAVGRPATAAICSGEDLQIDR